MEVLYHIRPYFVGIFPYIGLKNTYIGLILMGLVPPSSIGSCCMAIHEMLPKGDSPW